MAHQASGVNTIGIKEAVSGCYDPPVCKEFPDNWEDSFFSDLNVNQETIDINDSDDENNASDDYSDNNNINYKMLYSFCSGRETLIRQTNFPK